MWPRHSEKRNYIKTNRYILLETGRCFRSDGRIVDAHGAKIKCYPEVPGILDELHNEGYQLAVASRTSEIKGAFALVELFGWDKYFQYKEIYPGSKVTHFDRWAWRLRLIWAVLIRKSVFFRFKKLSGFEFKDMLFFDDEHRNIDDLTRHGVVSILVPNGVNKKTISEGLAEFARKSPWCPMIYGY